MRGFIQTHGVHDDLTHVQVSKITTVRVFLSLTVQLALWIHKIDVTTAFLNKNLKKSIYVTPPAIYKHLVPGGHSIKFLNALFGLKKEPRGWNATLYTFLCKISGIK